MKLKLKLKKDFLPAGLPFTDPRTGRQFDAYEHGLKAAVTRILEHRMSNPGIYPRNESVHFDPIAVTQEVFASAYVKRPDLFESAPGVVQVKVATVTPQAPGACLCGSTSWTEHLCPSCSGARRIGWKCDNCGTIRRS
jgi:hypothetical protein